MCVGSAVACTQPAGRDVAVLGDAAGARPLVKVVCAPLAALLSQSPRRPTNLAAFHPDRAAFPVLPAGRFAAVRKIGSGINGDIWRCRCEESGEVVAVKKIREVALLRAENAEQDDRNAHLRMGGRRSPPLEDALSEIGVMLRLAQEASASRYLLRARGVFTEAGSGMLTWVVMDLAEGGELFEEVSRRGVLPREEHLCYFGQLMRAVECLHSLRIGHRDISLENVLLNNGEVRLMDFGMAVEASDSGSGQPLRYFRAAGKDFYRAPECYVPEAGQANVEVPKGAAPGGIVSAACRGAYLAQVRLPASAVPGRRCRAEVVGYEAQPADVFAASVCLFIMANGVPAFQRATLDDKIFAFLALHGVSKLLEELRLEMDPDTQAVVSAAMQVDPARRPTASECLELHACLGFGQAAAGGA